MKNGEEENQMDGEEEIQMDMVHSQMRMKMMSMKYVERRFFVQQRVKYVARRQNSTLEISESKAEKLQHLHTVEEDSCIEGLVDRK